MVTKSNEKEDDGNVELGWGGGDDLGASQIDTSLSFRVATQSVETIPELLIDMD